MIAPPSPFRHLRGAAAAAVLTLAAALGGCGPGTGGTGIPPTAVLTLFGATQASVCTAPFSDLLCPRGTAGVATDPDLAQGAVMSDYADVQQGSNVSVAFRQSTIELNARCQRLHFEGTWGITASNDARFFGSYSIEPAGASIPASLTVQANDTGLAVVVREADGRLVLGPVQLQPVTAPVQPAACP